MKKQIAVALAILTATGTGAGLSSIGAHAAESSPGATSASSITTWTTTASWLNVRSGPSTSYRVLDALPYGSTVTGTQLSNGWVRFTHEGRTAYVSGRYLKASNSVTTADYVVTGASWLSIRTGPSISYRRVGAIPNGYVVTDGQKLSNGWVRFAYAGRTVYASGRYLTESYRGPDQPEPEEPQTVVRHVEQKAGDLFVDVYDRKIASSSYDVHYLPRGGMVKGVVEGSWFHMPGDKYVPMSDLTTSHTSYTGTNGRHDPSALCNMQGTDVSTHVLTACGAINDLKALNTAYAARFGEDLPWDECYRTYDTQVSYRNAFGTKAAVPGYSNHGSLDRPACDVPEQSWKFGFGTTRYNWMLANAPKYGWVHPSWAKPWGTNPEYWHFEYTG